MRKRARVFKAIAASLAFVVLVAANRVATILTNHLKVRNENTPDKAGALKAGKFDYTRKPEETFLQAAWLALRTGVLDLISLQASPIP